MTKTVVKFSPLPPQDMNKPDNCSLPFHKENKLIPIFLGEGGFAVGHADFS